MHSLEKQLRIYVRFLCIDVILTQYIVVICINHFAFSVYVNNSTVRSGRTFNTVLLFSMGLSLFKR
jgi:hypothetical protein